MLDFLKKLFGVKEKYLCGLLPLKEDARDFKLGIFGWGDYQPKSQKHIIDTVSVKNQYPFNTCSWNSRTVGKEVDEYMRLSVRFLVKMGVKLGLISGNGFADLRASETIVQKYGICEPQLLPENSTDWNLYSAPVVSQAMLDNAAQHRSSTFWRISNRNEAWKALDDGRTIRIGLRWRTAMNMQGGFSAPWILDFAKGQYVGGHAVLCVGYDTNYNGYSTFILQNSYGEEYGDRGKMYIKVEDFEREINYFGAFCDLDMPKDVASWLNEFNGKLVKDALNPDDAHKSDVYLIKDGKKKLLPDMATAYAHGYSDENIKDDEGMLSAVPLGDALNFWDGQNVMTIKALILRQQQLKPLFAKYFNELFI